MPGVHDLILFVISGIILNLTPGADVAYIVSRSASLGWKQGVVAVLGVCTGCLVHVFSAALGLSAILATSASAFTVVKLAGAAYLVYIGVNMLWDRNGKKTAKTESVTVSRRKVFSQGFLTNALNPKVALFFLAFLPQFVSSDAPSKPMAFLFLGVVFTFNAIFVNLLWAWAAARISNLLSNNGRFGAWAKRAGGAVFMALGIRLAMADSV
ncbi:LysE family translocator [uncultured Pseudodesulfovibrio sp.]|uniref:LysE family translocator n=1 Tax=uncultured Pseudodesulfovibrio sp. TaxID=2035858 RepID=UPI0029C96354|nr:LysE family translocator [uncultured Pseudodesulfovibrio sp.]